MRSGWGWVPCAVLAASGCGKVVAADGSGDDVGGDGGDDADARPPGEVRITLRGGLFGGRAEPLPGVPALFLDPDGELLVETTTDEHGEATADQVPAGSSAVLLMTVDDGPNGAPVEGIGVSVVGLQPGDDIELGGESDNGALLGSMTFNLPATILEPPPPGGFAPALRYRVSNGCREAQSFSTQVALDFSPPCVLDSGDTFRFLARAENASDGTIVGYAHADATFDPGGFVDVARWDAVFPIRVALGDVPPAVAQIDASLQPFSGGRRYLETNAISLTTVGDGATVDLPGASDFGDGGIVELRYRTNQQGLGEQEVQHRLAPGATSLDVAVSEELLPWYGPGIVDVDGRAILLNRTSSGTALDMQGVTAIWSEPDETFRYWLFVAPPDVLRVEIPTLPEAYAAWTPVDPMIVGVGVFGIDVSAWDGYDVARQHGFAALFDAAAIHVLDGPGSVRRSTSGGN